MSHCLQSAPFPKRASSISKTVQPRDLSAVPQEYHDLKEVLSKELVVLLPITAHMTVPSIPLELLYQPVASTICHAPRRAYGFHQVVPHSRYYRYWLYWLEVIYGLAPSCGLLESFILAAAAFSKLKGLFMSASTQSSSSLCSGGGRLQQRGWSGVVPSLPVTWAPTEH